MLAVAGSILNLVTSAVITAKVAKVLERAVKPPEMESVADSGVGTAAVVAFPLEKQVKLATLIFD